ncbi:hypothetical protein IZ6_10760 [Terrihabitans soli]|uniref:Uncharacterized protein n=1 Tax=Terrihabitans soli TaxID=708113 RepID=A0A6S6QTD8_9HYPH|nr:hypothetical protein [Terrihabitans soli]BCJ90341.1 hypothetical protein IZ6_10760 [Terrihabitans soli]
MDDRIPLSLLLSKIVSAELDHWISKEPEPKPSREEAAGLAIAEWLETMKIIALRR